MWNRYYGRNRYPLGFLSYLAIRTWFTERHVIQHVNLGLQNFWQWLLYMIVATICGVFMTWYLGVFLIVLMLLLTSPSTWSTAIPVYIWMYVGLVAIGAAIVSIPKEN